MPATPRLPAPPTSPVPATPPTLPAYAELHCISNYTFLRGASHPEELTERAARLGYTALAITDECSLAGVVRAHVDGKRSGLHLIIGTEIVFKDDRPGSNNQQHKMVLLAKNIAGYRQLCALITQARRRSIKGQYDARFSDIANKVDDCLLIWLPRLPDLFHAMEDQAAAGGWLAAHAAGRVCLGAEMHRHPHDRERGWLLQVLAERTGLRIVAAGDVHMHVRSRRTLQDVLTAIRAGQPVFQAGTLLSKNGERHLRQRHQLAQVYRPEWMAETLNVANLCTFKLDELKYEYPDEVVPAGVTPTQHLRNLTEEGVPRRFPGGAPDEVRQQIEHELALIRELGYENYFLTVADIVRFARSKGIACQGRGSAANSTVCYCLGVTEVDPARMVMLFERFISRERNEPPDIDIDFDAGRREEVIQYIYERYGRHRAALTANVIRYRSRSATRDVSKALGLAPDQVDKVTSALGWWDSPDSLPDRLREAGFDPDSPLMGQLVELVEMLKGFPRHLGQHPGGFVLARHNLADFVPVENAAMPERTIVEWDKDDLDSLGILKVDILGLGMLNAIHRGLAMIGEYHGRAFSMQDVPAEDAEVYDMLCAADSVGVFQVESRAQMTMLPRLKPRKFYDLVCEVAIVRPGPIQGGMVHPYLRRRQGLEAVSYPSDAIRKVLEPTLGIVLFQEQCMSVAMVAAGFSAGDADQLRRAMAAWRRRGGLEPFRERILKGMKERGYSDEFASQTFEQLKGFAAYGFPQSHAASFALLVYVSSWMKRYEPAVFLAALLNSQPMGFYAPAQLVHDAVAHGVTVRAVDVTVSAWDCTLERTAKAPAVRMGLRMVNGIKEEAGLRLMAARAMSPFTDVQDLAQRAGLDRRDLGALASANALAPLAGHRRDALWKVIGTETPMPVFAQSTPEAEAPLLRAMTEGENTVADYRAVGLTLGRHPLAIIRNLLAKRRLATAAELHTYPHGRLARACGLVTHRQRPETAKGAVFITLEDETGTVNVVVWSAVVDRFHRIMLTAQLLSVHGRFEAEGSVHHVIAEYLRDDTALLGELTVSSRDFR